MSEQGAPIVARAVAKIAKELGREPNENEKAVIERAIDEYLSMPSKKTH